ncbi:uncharacterized protein FFE2_02210 [Fusarium fujikuroi]|nr:uncharacterized protein FFE2_02210 [Fusarium fujikuroi]
MILVEIIGLKGKTVRERKLYYNPSVYITLMAV